MFKLPNDESLERSGQRNVMIALWINPISSALVKGDTGKSDSAGRAIYRPIEPGRRLKLWILHATLRVGSSELFSFRFTEGNSPSAELAYFLKRYRSLSKRLDI
ncbi:MAG: hypothetical protein P8166_05380 [Candidatus Thiodiazotropha sp.]